MANKFKIKRTSVAGRVPLATDLEVGELAVNLTDSRLFTKNGSNAVIDVVGQNVNTTANVVFRSITSNTSTVNNFIISGSLTANGSNGTAGQVLTSNGTSLYWSTVSGGGGGFTNGQSISVNDLNVSGNITVGQLYSSSGILFLGNKIDNQNQFVLTDFGIKLQANTFLPDNGKSLIANNEPGLPGQVLTSAGVGSNVYWSTVSGGGSFTNGQSISVNDLFTNGYTKIMGPLTIETTGQGYGTSGQVLTSNGNTVYWSTPAAATNANTDYFADYGYIFNTVSSTQDFGVLT